MNMSGARLLLLVFGVISLLAGGGVIAIGVGAAPIRPVLIAVGVALVLLSFLLFIIGYRLPRTRSPNDTKLDAGKRAGAYLEDQTELRTLPDSDVNYLVHFRKKVSGKNGNPSSLTIKLPAHTPGSVRFSRRNGFDRFGRGVGLTRPVPTEDADFDQAVAVRATHDWYADLLLADPIRRHAILALLDLGPWAVAFTGDNIEAAWTGFDPLKDDRTGLTDEVAHHLHALADELPATDGYSTRKPARPDLFLWPLLVGAALSLIALAVYPPVRFGAVFGQGMIVYAAVLPLFLLLAWALVRGTTVAHDRWALLALGAVFLLGLGCVGGVAWVNGAMCPGPETERTANVVNKYTTKNKNRTKYHVQVQDWANPTETIKFKTDELIFNQIQLGRSQVHIVTRPGWCGVEWEVGHRIQP